MMSFGMTFVLPWIAAAALGAAMLTVLLHLLSVRRPPPINLPTARFVPVGDARMVVRGTRPRDRLLLALRVAALLVIGAAFAGARCSRGEAGKAHIVVAPESQRSDSAMWWPKDVSLDDIKVSTIWAPEIERDPGAAIVLARREASRLFQTVLSLNEVALTVIMPPRVQSLSGWNAWRNDWPGEIRVIEVPASRGSDTLKLYKPANIGLSGVTVYSSLKDDPVTAALSFRAEAVSQQLSLNSIESTESDTSDTASHKYRAIVLRDSSNATLSSLATSRVASASFVEDTVFVYWPSSGAPAGWRASQEDTVGAVAAGNMALVAPFLRKFEWDEDSTSVAHSPSLPIVRWADGKVAAVENAIAGGCERWVYLPLNDNDDQLLSEPAMGVLQALLSPCGSFIVSTTPLRDTVYTMVASSEFRSAAPQSRTSSKKLFNSGMPRWLMPLLLLIAFLLLVAEQLVRRRSAKYGAGDS